MNHYLTEQRLRPNRHPNHTCKRSRVVLRKPPHITMNTPVMMIIRIAYWLLCACSAQAIAQTFSPAVPNQTHTQRFASYNVIPAEPNSYHTGVDIRNSPLLEYQDRTTDVRAVAPGVIKAIYGLKAVQVGDQTPGLLRLWNPGNPVSSQYTWTMAPPSAQSTYSNRGLGQCVIVYHPHLRLYTVYGHLDAVAADIAIGMSINVGKVLGKMGNSHYQWLRRCNPNSPSPGFHSASSHDTLCVQQLLSEPGVPTIAGIHQLSSAGFIPHVHLEAKERGLLGSGITDEPSDGIVGYSPGLQVTHMQGHPNYFGYHDPYVFFNNMVQVLSVPASVEVLQYPLNVRSYPSTAPPATSHAHVVTSIQMPAGGGTAGFVSLRQTSSGWYQVHIPNKATEGLASTGWIAGDIAGGPYSVLNPGLSQIEVVPESATVQAACSAGIALGMIHGGDTITRQRFVTRGISGTCWEINLTSNTGHVAGLVSQTQARLIPPGNTIEYLCFGDGSLSSACPCSNWGNPGHGCRNSVPVSGGSVSSGGARLTAGGVTSPDTVTLVSTGGYTTGLMVYFQGTTSIVGGVTFGDGVRCAGGVLRRLSIKNAVGGASQYPGPGDPTITAKSASLGDPIAPGSMRYYQTYYADASTSFCPSPVGGGWNVTNAVRITW